MWMPETRARYKPDHLRYSGHLSDEEWKLIAPFMPPPAKSWFVRFRDEGLWESLSHQLVMLDRERVGREASPSAAVIDSQPAGEHGADQALVVRPDLAGPAAEPIRRPLGVAPMRAGHMLRV